MLNFIKRTAFRNAEYLTSRHPELDSGSVNVDFLNQTDRFRVKHGMTKKKHRGLEE